MNHRELAAAALGAVLTLPAGGAAVAADAPAMSKCYGVAKAGKNDCQTATSACAGTSTQDGQPDAWLLLPKGSCEKIVGGSLTPPGR